MAKVELSLAVSVVEKAEFSATLKVADEVMVGPATSVTVTVMVALVETAKAVLSR